MKQDFDYVLMEDYRKDTKSLVEQSTNIIRKLKDEIEEKERLICALINSAKTIRVTNFDYITRNAPPYTIIEDHSTDSIIFRTELNNLKEEL